MRITEAAEFLRSGDNYLIMTHRRPDGDTLGCAAALTSALRRLGKTAHMLMSPQATEKFRPFVENYCAPEDGNYGGKTYVTVDVADLNMLPKGFPTGVELAIDHHPSNPAFGKRNLIEPHRAACGQIMLELIEELCGGLTAEEASLLYMAVSTDTGCFQYSNTDADTFAAAAKLAAYGADVEGINLRFFRSFSWARLTLEGLIYSSLRVYDDNKVAVAVVTQEMLTRCGATDNDKDDLASLAGKVEGNLVSATISETEAGTSKVSLRSTGDVNVSDICARFGGGGHMRAAGCEIQEAPEKVLEILVPILRDSIK